MNRINGLEVFSVGNWNDDEYTMQDLEDMVSAFNEHNAGLRPYMKLGHDPKQKLLQEDGLPAAGWVERLYIKGDRLLADITDIPGKIYDLIQRKAYRKVSCEIYWNLKLNGKTYSKVLAAIAFLGADTPGVQNLNDILALYKKDERDIHIYESDFLIDSKKLIETERTPTMSDKPQKTENEIKVELELEATKKEYAAKEAEAKKLADEKAATEKENQELREYKANAEKRNQELAAEAEKAKIAKFVGELQTEGLCTKAMVPMIEELIGEEKKEYTSVKDKKLTKQELLKESLKLFKAAAEVNFVENSSDTKEGSGDEEQEKIKKAKAYAKEHKVTFAQAVKALANK